VPSRSGANGRRQFLRCAVALLSVAAGLSLAAVAADVASPRIAGAAAPTSGGINTWSDGANTPTGLVVGPDGAIWWTNFGGDSIGRALPDGSGRATYRAPGISGPTSIVTGPDGALWFTNKTGGSIGRVTTAGAVTTYTDPTVRAPDSITTGPDGALWFANTSGATIGRITPAGAITSFSDPATSSVNDLTTGGDGNIWFTNTAGNLVGRMTPAGAVTAFTDAQFSAPGKITTAHDGSVVFTLPGGFGRYTMAGALTVGGQVYDQMAETWPAFLFVPSPVDLVSFDDTIWFINGGNAIGRVPLSFAPGASSNPGRDQSTDPGPMRGIARGPDGTVVFSAGAATIGSVDQYGSRGNLSPYASTFHPSISQPGSRANGSIVAGADGAMWFQSGAGIGRIGADLAFSTYSTQGQTPTGGMVSGPDGNLWFTVTGGIGRMRMNGSLFYYYNGSFSGAKGLTVGPDGALWFTATSMRPGTKGGIGRITTAGAITLYPNPGVNDPGSIATGPDGALWFTNTTTSTIGRATTAGAMTFFAAGGGPTDLVAGADGALWYVDGVGYIHRMTTAGVDSVIAQGLGARRLAVGPGGTIWATATGGRLWNVSASGTTASLAPAVADPVGIAVGPNGGLWFTNDSPYSLARSIGRAQVTGTPTLNVSGTEGDHQLVAKWDAIDGGSPITQVVVTASPGGATCTWTSGPQQCTISGLTNGSAYSLTATATNGSGSSDNGPSAPLTPAGVPGTPPTVTVTATSSSATLTWPAVADNGAPITAAQYRAYRGGTLERSGTLDLATPVIAGLTNGATYRFEVALTNRRGTGGYGTSAPTVIAIPGAPRAPGFPTVVGGPHDASRTGGEVTVSWWPQAGTTASIITTIELSYNDIEIRRTSQTFNDARNAHLITDLRQDGQRYRFEIALVNAAGVGPPSSTSTVNMGILSYPEPVNVVVGDGQATLSWGFQGQDKPRVTSTLITFSKDGVLQPSILFPGNANTQTITGLTNGSTYRFDVSLVTDPAGPGTPGVTEEVVIGAPKKLSFVTATAGPGPGQVKLSWWPADSNGSPITSYMVAPDVGYSLPWLTFTNVTGSSLIVSGLTSGTAYRFTIRATNARGWGQDSNITAYVTVP
jgi:streptogramin lyase